MPLLLPLMKFSFITWLIWIFYETFSLKQIIFPFSWVKIHPINIIDLNLTMALLFKFVEFTFINSFISIRSVLTLSMNHISFPLSLIDISIIKNRLSLTTLFLKPINLALIAKRSIKFMIWLFLKYQCCLLYIITWWKINLTRWFQDNSAGCLSYLVKIRISNVYFIEFELLWN